MTDNTKDQIAALQKEIEALKAKVDPPKSTFVPESDAEFRDRLHQMRERQANSWMHPNAVRDLIAAERSFGMMKEVALRDARAPNTPGTIPSSQQASSQHISGERGSGWVDAAPIGPPPGIRYVDAQLDAQDAKDRAELARKLGKG
jgi:hypothetical protein